MPEYVTDESTRFEETDGRHCAKSAKAISMKSKTEVPALSDSYLSYLLLDLAQLRQTSSLNGWMMPTEEVVQGQSYSLGS